MSEVVVTSRKNLQNEVRYGVGQAFTTDEPSTLGGDDAGPDPYTLILGALGQLYFNDGATLRAAQAVAGRERDCAVAAEPHSRARL